MSNRPDPKKAIHLEPDQPTLPGRKRGRRPGERSQRPRDSESPWKKAICVLRSHGVRFYEE